MHMLNLKLTLRLGYMTRFQSMGSCMVEISIDIDTNYQICQIDPHNI